MNAGQIVKTALMRSDLPTGDLGFVEMAIGFLDEIVQAVWESKKFQFRASKFYITTADGVDEYALPKLSGGVQSIVPNSFRGSDPVRKITFQPNHNFFKKHTTDDADGDPFIYRDGEFIGFQTQVSAASVITFVSSESNTTGGNISVIQGLKRMTLSSETLSAKDLGKWVRVGSDTKRYKIVSIEPSATGTSSVFYVHEEYDGTTNTSVSYVIGDVQQKATVLGLLTNGSVAEEEVQLNGSTSVATSKTFASIIRISKSDRTHGYITATSNSGAITNIVLDPAETEAEYQTVIFYPRPEKIETLSFYAYMKHPRVFKVSDSVLLPSQYHNLLVLDVYIRLETEWKKQEVSQVVLDRRNELAENMRLIDNGTDQWLALQESEEDQERSHNNFPTGYPNEY